MCPGTTSGDAWQVNVRHIHDTAADRAAPHAAPTLMALRDWLLVALSFSNVVELGLGAAGTRPPAGPDPVTVLIALAAFVAGAALAMPVLKAFDRNQEVKNNDVFQVWPRRVSITLGVALVLQAGFLAGWLATSSPAHLAYALVSLTTGAFLGDWMLGHAHPYAPVVPVILTAGVISSPQWP
jgi:hypothetical protein